MSSPCRCTFRNNRRTESGGSYVNHTFRMGQPSDQSFARFMRLLGALPTSQFQRISRRLARARSVFMVVTNSTEGRPHVPSFITENSRCGRNLDGCIHPSERNNLRQRATGELRCSRYVVT
jgi:hypothetical protein